MIVKTLLTSLFAVLLLSSCDPNSDKQVGNSDRFSNTNTGTGSSGGGGTTGGGGSTGSAGSTTDAPIDGGLGILLLAGTVYGAKRVRGRKQAKENK